MKRILIAIPVAVIVVFVILGLYTTLNNNSSAGGSTTTSPDDGSFNWKEDKPVLIPVMAENETCRTYVEDLGPDFSMEIMDRVCVFGKEVDDTESVTVIDDKDNLLQVDLSLRLIAWYSCLTQQTVNQAIEGPDPSTSVSAAVAGFEVMSDTFDTYEKNRKLYNRLLRSRSQATKDQLEQLGLPVDRYPSFIDATAIQGC